MLAQQIKNSIRLALEEDLGDGDITTQATLDPEKELTGCWIAKTPGIVAGLEVVRETFTQLGGTPSIEFYVHDGQEVSPGTKLGQIEGPGPLLLSGERVALNYLQRMSGIATATRRMVEAVAATKAVILDTRKTVPGLRLLDKMAVRMGGGQNHRFGLYDMVLIKDNHIAAAGSITRAVELVRATDERKRPIEVEVKNLAELKETLKLNVDRILLDNMSFADMRKAVSLTAGRTRLEASGNVTLKTVAEIAATGVDYISVGSLTHSVRALDISFLIS